MQRDPKKRNAPAATRASQKRLIGEQVMANRTLAVADVNLPIQEVNVRTGGAA